MTSVERQYQNDIDDLTKERDAAIKLIGKWATRAEMLVAAPIDHETWKRWRDLAGDMRDFHGANSP